MKNKNKLFDIKVKMIQNGLSRTFVNLASQIAMEFDGVYDLFIMWNDETDQTECSEIIATIQELIKDCNRNTNKKEKNYK